MVLSVSLPQSWPRMPVVKRARSLVLLALLILLTIVSYLRRRTKTPSHHHAVSRPIASAHLTEPITSKVHLPALKTSTSNDLVIIYVYHEAPDSRPNAEFFVRHGMHTAADFVFVFQGPTDLDTLIPSEFMGNTRIVRKGNDCYDIGTYGQVLQANNGELIKSYKRFILMNASIRGPFIPYWGAATCWSDAYTSKLSSKIKLVGMTYNCYPTRHVQSMILVTDSVGLDVLLQPAFLGTCWTDRDEAVDAEMRTTDLMFQAGYDVDVMMTSYQTHPDYDTTCLHGNLLATGAYWGATIHPYDTMFQKASHDELDSHGLALFTDWFGRMNYTSEPACAGARNQHGVVSHLKKRLRLR